MSMLIENVLLPAAVPVLGAVPTAWMLAAGLVETPAAGACAVATTGVIWGRAVDTLPGAPMVGAAPTVVKGTVAGWVAGATAGWAAAGVVRAALGVGVVRAALGVAVG